MKKLISVLFTITMMLAGVAQASISGPFIPGNLPPLMGKPAALEFLYEPGTTVHTDQHPSTAKIEFDSGAVDDDGTTFFIVSNKPDPFGPQAKCFFEGDVSFGEKFVAAAAAVGDIRLSNDIWIFLFDDLPWSGRLQDLIYHTSGSQPIQLGDVIGSVTLVAYQGENGQTAAIPESSTFSLWNKTEAGLYSDPANWIGYVPDGEGVAAHFGGSILEASSVTVQNPRILGTITFDHTASYTIDATGSGKITLAMSGGGDARINVELGEHTITAPLLSTGGLTADTADGTRLTLDTEAGYSVLEATLTKERAGTLALGSRLIVAGNLNHNGGVLEVGPGVLALPGGGDVTLTGDATLKASGVVSRRVLGDRTSTLEAVGTIDIGVLDDPNGYDYRGALKVGPHMVGLRDGDMAKLYGGATIEGGKLSSYNGIEVQPGIPGPTQGATQIRGYGVIDNAVHFDQSVVWADGDNGGITLSGIVSGNPRLLRNVWLTGLNRLGASPVHTPISGGMGPKAVSTRVIYGPDHWSFHPDAWVALGGQYDAFPATDPMILDGKLNVLLEGYEPTGSESFGMFDSLVVPDWEMYGSFSGWFSEVNLPVSMTDWFWKFTYEDGSTSMGGAPESGRSFLGAALIVPEPGTLVLLITGGLCLLLYTWRKRRRR